MPPLACLVHRAKAGVYEQVWQLQIEGDVLGHTVDDVGRAVDALWQDASAVREHLAVSLLQPC